MHQTLSNTKEVMALDTKFGLQAKAALEEEVASLRHQLAKADTDRSSKVTCLHGELEQSQSEARNLTIANTLLQSQIRAMQTSMDTGVGAIHDKNIALEKQLADASAAASESASES